MNTEHTLDDIYTKLVADVADLTDGWHHIPLGPEQSQYLYDHPEAVQFLESLGLTIRQTP